MFDDFTMPAIPDGWDFTTGLRRYVVVGEQGLVNSWTMAREQVYDGDFKLLRDVWGTVRSEDPDTVSEARSFHDALDRMKDDWSLFLETVAESPVDLARAVARAFDLKFVVAHLYRPDREGSGNDENATLHASGSVAADEDEKRGEFDHRSRVHSATVLAEHGQVSVRDNNLIFRTYIPILAARTAHMREGYWEHEFSLSSRIAPESRFVVGNLEP